MTGNRVAIIGAGISGLTAAWALVREDPGLEVVVFDASDRVGGKLRGETVAGVRVDVGAEAMLARRPEGTDLVRELGLGDQLVHPTASAASIWTRDALHPMPRGPLMGIPSGPAAVAGLLTAEEAARVEQERTATHQPVTEDLSVGELVEQRVGAPVVDRLVEPLLGGVYAGHARNLSAQATVPAVFEAARAGESLTERAARSAAPATSTPSPVFAGLPGGMARVPERLGQVLTESGVQIHSGRIVRQIRPHDGGWQLTTGPTPDPRTTTTDAVIVAVPAAPAARLLADVAPRASAELTGIEYASMAIVTLALDTAVMSELPGPGFLVPPVDGRTLKAATFSANKWDWVAEAGRSGAAGDVTLLRVSVGRHREERALQRGDEELVAIARAELGEALGRPLPEPVDAHVQRWGGGLPQYAVGHRARVERIRADIAEVGGVQVCGAAYDGVGIPACIASARLAAQAALTHLRAGIGRE